MLKQISMLQPMEDPTPEMWKSPEGVMACGAPMLEKVYPERLNRENCEEE